MNDKIDSTHYYYEYNSEKNLIVEAKLPSCTYAKTFSVFCYNNFCYYNYYEYDKHFKRISVTYYDPFELYRINCDSLMLLATDYSLFSFFFQKANLIGSLGYPCKNIVNYDETLPVSLPNERHYCNQKRKADCLKEVTNIILTTESGKEDYSYQTLTYYLTRKSNLPKTIEMNWQDKQTLRIYYY